MVAGDREEVEMQGVDRSYCCSVVRLPWTAVTVGPAPIREEKLG